MGGAQRIEHEAIVTGESVSAQHVNERKSKTVTQSP
jgi:hypothetical protein